MKAVYSVGAAIALTLSVILPVSATATPQPLKSTTSDHTKWQQHPQSQKSKGNKKVTRGVPQKNKKSSTSEKIVFVDFDDNNQGLFLINPDGSNPVKIVDGWAKNASLTPDGSKIIFLGFNGEHFNIFSVNVDGTGLTQLTKDIYEDIYDPQISPDGKKIIFTIVFYENNSSDIFVMNTDGSGIEKLTSTVNEYKYSPSFSPDGKKIIYNVADNTTYTNDIYIMDHDGKNPENITQTPDLSEDFPRWSPDGNLISFRVNKNVFTIKPDGSTRSQATYFTGEGYVINPVWSPDGKSFVLTYNDANYEDGDYIESPTYLSIVPIGGTAADLIPIAKDGSKYAYDWGFIKE